MRGLVGSTAPPPAAAAASRNAASSAAYAGTYPPSAPASAKGDRWGGGVRPGAYLRSSARTRKLAESNTHWGWM